MTLTVKLAEQEQRRLEILVQILHSGNQSEAIRKLINEKFEAIQAEKTLVQRRGGHPKHLLEGSANASDRSARKSAVDKLLKDKAKRRAD